MLEIRLGLPQGKTTGLIPQRVQGGGLQRVLRTKGVLPGKGTSLILRGKGSKVQSEAQKQGAGGGKGKRGRVYCSRKGDNLEKTESPRHKNKRREGKSISF